MFSTRKRYRRPFLVEPSKLTRIISVATESFQGTPLTISFRVFYDDGRADNFDSVEPVLALDNSERNPIKRLLYQVRDTQDTDIIEIDFDGNPPVDCSIAVWSYDHRHGNDVFSRLEEQVERCFQSSFVPKIKYAPFLSLAGFAIVFATVSIFLSTSPDSNENMFLTLEQIDTLLAQRENQDLSDRVVELQLKNIQNEKEVGLAGSAFVHLRDWRVWSIAGPVLIVVILFFYAVLACYPRAVFLWGDWEERYRSLSARRRSIWFGIIGTLFISAVASMLVMGIESFIRG